MTAPDWFAEATGTEARTGHLRVHGAQIGYRIWGNGGDSSVVLIHGGAANAHWWGHIAPLLARDRHIVALDLSGHGTSGHRTEYNRSLWVDEVMAVANLVGPRPTVVGHSLGGLIALEVAARHGAELAGVVVADSPIKMVGPKLDQDRLRRLNRRLRDYRTTTEIVARFRPDPEDAVLPHYLREYLGRRSIKRVSGGYRWQFDPRISMGGGMAVPEVVTPNCRVALVRGERGMLDRDVSRVLADRFGPGTVEVTVPDCGHHLMLDQPLVFAAVLDTVLRSWSASDALNTALL